jgi:cytochrome b pre-mRNA-processing protein 3
MFDAFLRGLDDAMREMGVGDLSVGKKMRRLGEAFYGRAKRYDAAIDDPAELAALVRRTLYADAEDAARADAGARLVAAYAARAHAALAVQPLERLLAGEATFPDLDAATSAPISPP